MWCAFAACQLLVTPYEFQNSGYHAEPGLVRISSCGYAASLPLPMPFGGFSVFPSHVTS